MSRRDGTRAPLARGVPLGRCRGVPITVHWSVPAAVALLATMLAGEVLPAWAPHRSAGLYWAVTAITAAGYLAALVGHELVHTVAARHYHLRVRRVWVWLLGGISELDADPPTPRAEAVVAAAGPLTSLGVGGGLAGLAAVAGHGLPAIALGLLAGVNLLLGAVNLLPDPPLDGGWLLCVAVWARTGDRGRVSEVAARAGRGLGLALLTLGAIEILAGAATCGIWLMLLGWSTAAAATADRNAAGRVEDLRGLTVRDVMSTPPATVPSWWTVADFLTNLGQVHPIDDAYVLVDLDGRPTGVLTVAALTRVQPADRPATRLRDCRGAGRPLTVSADTPLDRLLVPLRLQGGIAAVTENGRIAATASLRAVTAARQRARLDLVTTGHEHGK